jgi:hypothetical protein
MQNPKNKKPYKDQHMITHHVYTRICKFCTTVLMIKISALLAVVFTLMVSPVLAQSTDNTCSSDVFYIQNIETSAVADTSQKARVAATTKALLAAWQALNGRLLLSGQTLQTNFTAEDVMPYLDYTRVVSETVLPSRYIATFDYCFDPVKVRDFYGFNNLRHAELFSDPILVLPIWNGLDGPRLWSKPNPWVEAWVKLLSEQKGLLDLRLPNNLATERTIDAVSIQARDRATLSKAAELEDSERVLVMVMTPTRAGRKNLLDVKADLYDRSGLFESMAYTLDDAEVTIESLIPSIDNIALAMLESINEVWRRTNVVNIEEGGILTVTVKTRSIKEWVATLDTLRVLQPVESLSVIKLDSDGGIVRIKLAGSVRSLSYALERRGLKLNEENLDDTSFLSLEQIIN